MKQRIKIDSTILSAIIILTGFLGLFKRFYMASEFWEVIFDSLGFILIFKGTLLRMASRGHKKAASKQSHALVKSGPYTIARNPMYLGSFLIGAGFVLLVWPWWMLPVFAGLFYLRFNKEIMKEEGFLTKHFGKEYETYCQKVPRLFPTFAMMNKLKLKDTFDLNEAFRTKETWGLLAWPVLAVILGTLQRGFIFGTFDLGEVLIIFFTTASVLLIGLAIVYSQQ